MVGWVRMETDREFTDTDCMYELAHIYIYACVCVRARVWVRICERKFPMLGNDPVPTNGVNVTRNA